MRYRLTTLLIAILLSTNATADHPGGTVYADVNGLVCDFCARAIEKVFSKRSEVNAINIDLDEKVIMIHFAEDQSLADATIIEMINDSGYDVRALRYE